MTHNDLRIGVIIVAAGRGMRASAGNADELPKQYRQIAGRSVLGRTLDAFSDTPGVGAIQVVIGADDHDAYARAVAPHPLLAPPVAGGKTRQESVLNGLEAISATNCNCILIHDAARPFVSPELIARLVTGYQDSGGCAQVPALSVVDAVKQVAGTEITGSVPRETLKRVQTPQLFALDQILRAHRLANQAGHDHFADDAAVLEWAGLPVSWVQGDTHNVKVTTPEDFVIAEQYFSANLETRMATGYDVHRFKAGDHVILGGMKIDHTASLDGHSDADVVLHALTDALMGCLNIGDVGTLFPPSDATWKDADSAQFLAAPATRITAAGGTIVFLDVTIIAEAPKIGPHRAAMQQRIADICAIPPHRVSIKATTNERMGFVGREEGIACQAAATVRLPSDFGET